MPVDLTKNKRLVVVVSLETADAIEALAQKDRRPMSAYVRNLLEDHVRANTGDTEDAPVAVEQTTEQHVYTQIIAAAVQKLQGDQ